MSNYERFGVYLWSTDPDVPINQSTEYQLVINTKTWSIFLATFSSNINDIEPELESENESVNESENEDSDEDVVEVKIKAETEGNDNGNGDSDSDSDSDSDNDNDNDNDSEEDEEDEEDGEECMVTDVRIFEGDLYNNSFFAIDYYNEQLVLYVGNKSYFITRIRSLDGGSDLCGVVNNNFSFLNSFYLDIYISWIQAFLDSHEISLYYDNCTTTAIGMKNDSDEFFGCYKEYYPTIICGDTESEQSQLRFKGTMKNGRYNVGLFYSRDKLIRIIVHNEGDCQNSLTCVMEIDGYEDHIIPNHMCTQEEMNKSDFVMNTFNKIYKESSDAIRNIITVSNELGNDEDSLNLHFQKKVIILEKIITKLEERQKQTGEKIMLLENVLNKSIKDNEKFKTIVRENFISFSLIFIGLIITVFSQ